MNSIDKLSEIFSRFPGIGPRQAKRFVYFLLSRHPEFREDLIRALGDLRSGITQCEECRRYFSGSARLCSICADTTRDRSLYMIVPRDVDLEAIEKSGSFKGYYFVLGGSIPILEKEPEKKIRMRELGERIAKRKHDLMEIILAMNATSEGENTADYLKEEIKKLVPGVPVSVLGRGLSTGSELEYADPETLRNALLHRTK